MVSQLHQHTRFRCLLDHQLTLSHFPLGDKQAQKVVGAEGASEKDPRNRGILEI